MTLEIKHITKSFGERNILLDVSFKLKEGSVAVLMGANGSGKTTLYNIITGYLKADRGKVILGNEDLNTLKPFERNIKGICRTFQDMRLINDLTVLENVMLAFQNQEGETWWESLFFLNKIRGDQSKKTQSAKAILEKCFISDVIDSKAGEISYGQQKLLNLACCIANNSKVLLLDEPVAGLNPIYRKKLEGIIEGLKTEKIVMIIEHNMDFIESVADEIFFLHEGTIMRFRDYRSMRENEFVQKAYL